MQIGILAPLGYGGEYEGWEPSRAFDRMLSVARAADEIGFDSFWLNDHFLPGNSPVDRFNLEAFITAAAIARETKRTRIGHLVACASFRNPGLTAKMASTLDVASGGRYELGLGAGWKEDEWRTFGYGFPPARQRLTMLKESLAIVTSLLRDGSSTFSGEFNSTTAAVNEPRGIQRPSIPIIVGGNGERVTWALAAKYADELNLDALPPSEVERVLPLIRAHCSKLGRAPDSLRVSVHVWGTQPAILTPQRIELLKRRQVFPIGSSARVELLKRYEALGVARLQIRCVEATTVEGELEKLAADCTKAGLKVQ